MRDAEAQPGAAGARGKSHQRRRPRAASEFVDRRNAPPLTFDPRAVQRNLLNRGSTDFRRNLIHRIRHATGAGKGAPPVTAPRKRSVPQEGDAGSGSDVPGGNAGSDAGGQMSPRGEGTPGGFSTPDAGSGGGSGPAPSPPAVDVPSTAQVPRLAGGVTSDAAAWVPSSSVSACQLCNVRFTITNRKHHCRGCGKVVCARCSPYRLYVEAVRGVARVCFVCAHKTAGEVWEMARNDTALFLAAAERGDALAVEWRLGNGQNPNAFEVRGCRCRRPGGGACASDAPR